MVTTLPPVGRIQGAQLQPSQTPEASSVRIEYSDRSGLRHALTMPFLDAMYLLNLLKSIQLDAGYEMPDDPRL